MTTNEPVVISFPTVLDGTVVRWYRDVDAAEDGLDWASASRNGVTLDMAPREVAMAAFDVHGRLNVDARADLSDVVTHRKAPFTGRVTPIGGVS